MCQMPQMTLESESRANSAFAQFGATHPDKALPYLVLNFSGHDGWIGRQAVFWPELLNFRILQLRKKRMKPIEAKLVHTFGNIQ